MRTALETPARWLLVCLAWFVLFEPGRVGASLPPTEPYAWSNVVIGGGGFVTGIITHPRQKGLMYARTDVGGAYRWDASAQRWIPLTDGIGDVDFTGIESLAVDPSDPGRVYLAAGIYSRGKAAILRSADQGRTWLRTDVPFKMGGNEAGRFNGERLAVDPNDGDILFFGSRRDGLWKSADRGAVWQKVEGFPDFGFREAALANAADSRSGLGLNQQPVGIVCVLFDPAGSRPGQPTPTLYAAVSTTETNLYRSTDGGVTWLAVADQPVGLRPNHLVRATDGTLYLSYGKEPGPNTMTDGAVWKFNPEKGAWKDITPLKPAQADQTFGYGAVAVDAQHPSTIVAATFAHWKPCDEIFRSTNGGASWTPLLPQAVWDHAAAPYTQNLNPHWMGDLEINPFNSDQVLFVTGYGIWSCSNLTAADADRPTRWTFLDNGLEETVPLALLSPPEGAHLLSGVGDIDGFRHDDLNVSPIRGSFDGPRYSNTEDMALAGKNPQVIVRTGTSRSGAVRAAISADGGKTWNALGREPTNSAGAGTIAVSADGRIIVWTPRRGAPSYSNDRGNQWSACAGISPHARVVADAVNPARFYTFDLLDGRLLASTNGAASFAATPAAFPKAEGSAGRSGFSGAGNAALFPTPGIEGDLWLAFNNANGLYHSTNGGASFARSDRVQEAYSLGFGKAAPGRDFPALYLAGKIEQIPGLFRSDDAGTNWVRINDDQHQFGWIGHVTGDPRIYGRVYFATGGRGIIYGDPVPIQARNNL
jgi:photosystem II stability/assembly factor-like uncharacterized protein